jgi:hypothetical protein
MKKTDYAAKAAKMEVQMPGVVARPDAASRVKTAGLVTAGVTVVGVYVGIPLAGAASAATHAFGVEAGFAGSFLLGMTAVVFGILIETSKTKRAR